MLINLAYLLNRPTGTTTYALNLLPHLQGLSPICLATPASGLSQYIPVPRNMTATQGTFGHLHRLLWTQLQLPRLARNLYAARIARSPFIFSPIPEAPLSIPASVTNLPRPRFAVTCHDLIPLRFPEFFGAIKLFFRYYVPQVLAQAEIVLCNSEATAKDIVDLYGLSAHKLVPIPLAHDAQHFQPAQRRPPCLAQAGVVEGRPYFVMLGRQAPYKNVGRVIAAMSELPPDCLLLIAGPTDARYTPKLQLQIDELELRDRVRFLSYVPYNQLPALLSHALALVFPSLWEGFGLPVLEAMACGTPVICSEVAALVEVAGEAALFVNPTEQSTITAAMQQVTTDEFLRQQLRAAGIAQASKFSWEKTGRATADVLARFL